jgi:hypothetical protein
VPCGRRAGNETRRTVSGRRDATLGSAVGVPFWGGTSFSESGDPPEANKRPTAAEPDEPRDATAQTRPREPEPEPGAHEAGRPERPQGTVPGRERRRVKVERGAMRVVATGGIIPIAVVLGAVLVARTSPAGSWAWRSA